MKEFIKKLYFIKESFKKFDDAFMAHHKTVLEFKKDIANVPYYNIELVFTVIWMVTALIASCSISELFGIGEFICSWGSDFVARVKYIAFFTYLCQFYLEYRRFVFIYTTEKYSKNMKIYMFIRQILKNIFVFTAMVITLNSTLETYGLNDRINKIEYRPDKFYLDYSKIELWKKVVRRVKRNYTILQRLRVKWEKKREKQRETYWRIKAYWQWRKQKAERERKR